MRADRLLAIMLLLQTRGKMKAETLAEELEVSRRTILRDIEALSVSGVPIYAEGGHGGGIALDENYRTNLIGLQEEEARTLFLASNERLLKQLKLGEAAERILEPYSLIAKSSIWYLIAKREREFRIYRVTRFHELTLLNEHFERNADYDLPSYWQSHLEQFIENMASYRFTVEVHPDRLTFVKWITPGRHQITEPTNTDGWYTVTIQTDSVDLARMLIFGLGTQAKVVEPRKLHDEVLAAAREFCSRFSE